MAPWRVTKAITEANILRAMNFATDALGRITDEAAWRKMATLHLPDATLDERSIALIKRQNPSLSEDDFSRLLQRFQESIALDTVRNEYLMHAKLYTWMLKDPARDDVNS